MSRVPQLKDAYYRPHPKDGEGNVFSLSTPGGGGRVPISHNALQHFPECHGADTRGGVPCQVQPGGYPAGGVTLLGGGYPAGGRYLGMVPPWPGQEGGTLPGGTQVWYPPGQVRMGGYPVRTTEGVVTTRRAVCLLCSRRRTFLLQ